MVKIIVSNEYVESYQASNQWTSYHALILDEYGRVLPNDFLISLILCRNNCLLTLLTVYLKPDVYDEETGLLSVAFQLPPSDIIPPGDCIIKLRWYDQIHDSTPYEAGESRGVPYCIADIRTIKVENESVESQAEAPGYWLSYYATLTDGYGNPLPEDVYVKLYLGDVEVAAVTLASDVYDVEKKQVAIAFQVPNLGEGLYHLRLVWDEQVSQQYPPHKYLADSSLGLPFQVVREALVVVTNEWVEKSWLSVGEWTSYHATVYDAEGDAVPRSFPFRLFLGNRIVARGVFAEDIYDPLSKEAKIAFQVPYDMPEGTYVIRLEWDGCLA